MLPHDISACKGLTHLPLDKMVIILADNILKCIYLNESDKNKFQWNLNQNSVIFYWTLRKKIQWNFNQNSKGTINNINIINSANGLVPVLCQAIIWTNDLG